MGNQQLRQHFENARKTGILKISQQRLHEFPAQLKNYPNVLKTIDFSENRFERIPEELIQFKLVRHLNMSGNRITELSDVLGELRNLEVLIANDNLIMEISKTLKNCDCLKTVILSNNQLTEFPIIFCRMKHLDILDLSRNQITVVPSEIKHLYAIELNLNKNQISLISEDIAEAPNLKTLRLEENRLTVDAFTPRILKDSKICNIYTDGNLFSSHSFTELDGYDVFMERHTAVKKKAP